MLDSWSDDPAAFSPELRRAYIASFRDPATVAAICEEYRAAATLDVVPADDVTGAQLDCGHFLPEEAPADTTRHLMDFLRPPGEPPSSPPRCTGSRSTS
jgi:haloacetate dehalogenase